MLREIFHVCVYTKLVTSRSFTGLSAGNENNTACCPKAKSEGDGDGDGKGVILGATLGGIIFGLITVGVCCLLKR